jgi:hypothetical protein
MCVYVCVCVSDQNREERERQKETCDTKRQANLLGCLVAVTDHVVNEAQQDRKKEREREN